MYHEWLLLSSDISSDVLNVDQFVSLHQGY